MPPSLRTPAAVLPAAAALVLAVPALAAAAPPPPVPSGASPLAPERQALRDYVSSGAYVQDVAAVVTPAKAALAARVDEIARQRTACQVAGVGTSRASVRAAMPTSTRGTVRLTVRRDLVKGLRVTARDASASARVAVLPVDTAAVTASTASVRTLGTLTLARGSRKVVLRSVHVSLRRTSAAITASIAGRRITLARTPSGSRRRATLNAAGRAEIIAARLQLTSAGRTALRRLAPRSRTLGLLTVQVEPARTSPATPGTPSTPGGTTTTPPTTTTSPATTPTVAAPTPVAPTPAFVPDAPSCAQVPTKPVIVLDIDETALSAYVDPSGNAIPLGDPGNGTAGQLPELVGTARALSPVKDLYDFAVSHGVGVDFITGRVPQQQTTTETNLGNEGYTQRVGITFRASTSVDSATYKRDARAALQQQGYTILLNVGDQCSDLFGGNAERAFKLPNTFYFTSDAPTSVDPRCDKLGAGGEVPTS